MSTGGPVTIDVTGNDSDPDGDLDPSTVRVVQQPQNGVASCSNGSCTYGPIPGFSGIDTFIYEVCDSTGACDTAVVMVTVTSDIGGDTGGGSGGGGDTGGDTPTDDIGDGAGGVGDDIGDGAGGVGDDVGGITDQPPGHRNDSSLPSPGASSDDPMDDPDRSDPSLSGPGSEDPVQGAPRGPALPFTGAGQIALYLAMALNLLVLGGLVLLAIMIRERSLMGSAEITGQEDSAPSTGAIVKPRHGLGARAGRGPLS